MAEGNTVSFGDEEAFDKQEDERNTSSKSKGIIKSDFVRKRGSYKKLKKSLTPKRRTSWKGNDQSFQ